MSRDPSEDEVDPYCIACGGLVGYYEHYGPYKEGLSSGIPFQMDRGSRVQWTSLYRAIFKPDPEREKPLRLSGIGRYDAFSKYLLKVTWDRDLDNIGTPQYTTPDFNRNYIWAINFLNMFNMDMPSVGFLIHANCWALLERRFLGSRMLNDLELFVDICAERFYENPYDIDQFANTENGIMKGSIPSKTWQPPEKEPCWFPHGSCYGFIYPNEVNICEFENKRTQHVTALRDPLNIPEIPMLIRHSMQNKAREGMKRKTRKWSLSISLSPEEGRARSREYHQLAKLPLDIILLVLDNLSRCADIRNALMAFGWKVPDPYWKSRVPRDLIFEVEEITRPDDMDWKFFFLGIRDLQDNSPELKNRQRVLGLLEEISRRFLARCKPEN